TGSVRPAVRRPARPRGRETRNRHRRAQVHARHTGARMTLTPPVARARHLGMRFGDVAALTDADFTLHRNTIYGLLGRNGAGKTTLMQLLAGHMRPTTGSVEVFGADPYENTAVLQQLCFVADT